MLYCKNNLVTLKFSSKCSVNTGMSIESLHRSALFVDELFHTSVVFLNGPDVSPCSRVG